MHSNELLSNERERAHSFWSTLSLLIITVILLIIIIIVIVISIFLTDLHETYVSVCNDQR